MTCSQGNQCRRSLFSDPNTDKSAKKYDEITFNEVIENDLSVMDMTAVVLCRDHKMPIIVCNIDREDNLLKAANGDPLVQELAET